MANTTGVFVNITVSELEKISESIIPPILQFALGVIGNVTALLFLICTSKRHRWKPFYRLVGALAVTDLSGVLFTYPAVLMRYISNFTFVFSKELCDYFSFCFSFAFLSSAFIVCAMSFDRYLAIIHPIFYYTNSNTRRTNSIIVLTWLTAGSVCILPVAGLGTAKLYYPGSWCFSNFASSDTKDRINTYIYSVIGVVVLFSTVTVNIIVIGTLCRNSFRKGVEASRGKKNDFAVIIIILVFVTVFSVCWVPLMLLMLHNASSNNPENGPEKLLAVRFTITNGIIDPWIYILFRKENILALFKLFPRLDKKFGWINTDSQLPNVVDEENTKSLTSISTTKETTHL